jgi:tRNA(Ile)-lysidine synthase
MFITPSEFNQLMAPFAPFDSPPRIAVATSGGPDSLALALLSHQWAKSHGGEAIALTVDHRLREGSSAEAHQVGIWLKRRGMEHHTLPWERTEEKDAPRTAIQARARKARYRLLSQWCADHGVKHLLTAHHMQDQVETFMIRLAKGSGLKGLTSIQGVVSTDFGRILRPFLTLDPSRLKATLDQFNQPFISDPSNENTTFTRVRWRQLLPLLALEGLTTQPLRQTLDRLTHAQRLVDQYTSTLLQQHALLSLHGYATLKKEALQESPEAFEEMLKRILATIGTRAYPVQRKALHRAIEMMISGNSLTLGGCQILRKPEGWWIVREYSAIQKNISVQQPGTYLWDNRFTVTVDAPCQIGALGTRGIQQQGKAFKEQTKSIPHIVLKTLPALWQGEKLLVPFPPFAFTPPHSWLAGGMNKL